MKSTRDRVFPDSNSLNVAPAARKAVIFHHTGTRCHRGDSSAWSCLSNTPFAISCIFLGLLLGTLSALQPALGAPNDEGADSVERIESTRPAPASAETKASSTNTTNSAGNTPFEDIPQFGGPSSVGSILKEDAQPKQPAFRFDTLRTALKPYFDFKDRLSKDYGLSLGTDYTTMYQWANRSPRHHDGAGGLFRFFGNWTVLGRDSGYSGSLVFKIENRHRYGNLLPPKDLGFEIGYAGFTAPIYANYDWGLTNFYWKQQLFDGQVSFVAGTVDVTDYLDVYGMVNPWTAFSNLAFLTSATIPAPNPGLGAALGIMLTDQIYLLGGFADANGEPSEFTDNFTTFFRDGEYFKHVEIGWTPSRDRIYLDNIHITGWQVDAREQAATPSGWGISFSAATLIDGSLMPFLRGGYAKDGGALWEGSISTGLGYYMNSRSDLAGLGLNWSRPSKTSFGPGLSDQYTIELFYRLQLSENFALTPDVQYIIGPANNPQADQTWVLGIRARLAL